MYALVIPSNREAQLREFLRAWDEPGDWHEVIVVEDAPQRSFTLDCRWPLTHVSHAEAKEILGRDAWIISRRDSACRALGFLVAAERGAEWILTLDDDCRPQDAWTVNREPWTDSPHGPRPTPHGICAAHLAALDSHTVCQPTAGIRTRGLPYRDLGRITPKLNMGLWCNVADLDAPQSLVTPGGYFTPPAGSRLAHPCQRYPVCGMNLFFHRDLLPALYFPPMGEGRDYRRFDDIWFGWAFQRLAQQCGINWSFGDPAIEHIRASDPFKNLVAEAPGIAVNEWIWRELNDIPLSAPTLADAAAELADAMQQRGGYLATWGEALAVWLRHTGRLTPHR